MQLRDCADKGILAPLDVTVTRHNKSPDVTLSRSFRPPCVTALSDFKLAPLEKACRSRKVHVRPSQTLALSTFQIYTYARYYRLARLVFAPFHSLS